MKRDTRTPADNGPISLEVIKPGKNGIFYLLYFPYPKDDKYSDDEAKEDMEFPARNHINGINYWRSKLGWYY